MQGTGGAKAGQTQHSRLADGRTTHHAGITVRIDRLGRHPSVGHESRVPWGLRHPRRGPETSVRRDLRTLAPTQPRTALRLSTHLLPSACPHLLLAYCLLSCLCCPVSSVSCSALPYPPLPASCLLSPCIEVAVSSRLASARRIAGFAAAVRRRRRAGAGAPTGGCPSRSCERRSSAGHTSCGAAASFRGMCSGRSRRPLQRDRTRVNLQLQ